MKVNEEYREKILDLYRSGKDHFEIAKELKLTIRQTYDCIRRNYGTVRTIKRKKKIHPGPNADRHLCKTCCFRSWGNLRTKGAKCEYIIDAGHSRGCDPSVCDKYKKGPVIKRKAKPLDLAGGKLI